METVQLPVGCYSFCPPPGRSPCQAQPRRAGELASSTWPQSKFLSPFITTHRCGQEFLTGHLLALTSPDGDRANGLVQPWMAG